MTTKVRVAILDDHPSSVDGYLHRLKDVPQVEVVGTAAYGDELEPMLVNHPAEVLLLDVNVPTSAENRNPYPILHAIPHLLQSHPNLAVLVISMLNERHLIQGVMDAGASGYILKDDGAAWRELSAIIQSVSAGGIYLSQEAYQQVLKRQLKDAGPVLTNRQREVLSLCCAYPDISASDLSAELKLRPSTVRNLLSNAYLRLGVRTRAGAISRARELGLITPLPPGAET
jgi:DNA-binding NarL/FixJ family response regulator